MDTFDAESDREEFQRRSDAYEPQVEGPLVKPRSSISSLIREYQHAEQAFQTKIATLSLTHPSYRAIKGDGKCGWTGNKAAVFGYIELLLTLGDSKKVEAEMTRLRSFTRDIEELGYDLGNIEFAIDATFDFMQSLHDAMLAGSAGESFLLENFNDENTSNCIIYYFKLMTSSFMQKNAQTYQYFVAQPVDIYCKNFIEPQAQEIEQPGLQALTSGVIGPAGFAVDVLYLDRSAGDQVTAHHLVENYEGLPLIALLYRPGHYDLVYKDNTPLQVQPMRNQVPNFVSAFTSEQYYCGEDHASLLSNEASIASGLSLSTAPFQPSNVITQNVYTPPLSHSASSTSPTDLSAVSEEAAVPNGVSGPEDKIRFNPYMLYPNDTSMPLSTSVFKNSPFNPNHFQNQSFHPQQYVPEEQQLKSRSRRSNSTKSMRSRGGGRSVSSRKHK